MINEGKKNEKSREGIKKLEKITKEKGTARSYKKLTKNNNNGRKEDGETRTIKQKEKEEKNKQTQ